MQVRVRVRVRARVRFSVRARVRLGATRHVAAAIPSKSSRRSSDRGTGPGWARPV